MGGLSDVLLIPSIDDFFFSLNVLNDLKQNIVQLEDTFADHILR